MTAPREPREPREPRRATPQGTAGPVGRIQATVRFLYPEERDKTMDLRQKGVSSPEMLCDQDRPFQIVQQAGPPQQDGRSHSPQTLPGHLGAEAQITLGLFLPPVSLEKTRTTVS